MEYQEQIMIDAANKLKNANDELEMSMYGRIYREVPRKIPCFSMVI